MKSKTSTVIVVVIAAVVALVVDSYILGAGRTPFSWMVVLQGAVIGVLVCATWTVAGTRQASIAGLAVCVVLVLGGLASITGLAELARSPMIWAVATALVARLIRPGRVLRAAQAERAGVLAGK